MVEPQLLKAGARPRAKIKSNFLVQVHSFSRSSISKLQLGYTLRAVDQSRRSGDRGPEQDSQGWLDRAQIDPDNFGPGVELRCIVSALCSRFCSRFPKTPAHRSPWPTCRSPCPCRELAWHHLPWGRCTADP